MSSLSASAVEITAAALFLLALIHTFAARAFEHLAHTHPAHAGLWHLLGEVEVVFGLWALILMLCLFALLGQAEAIAYLESRDFTEPLFVFAIMVIAASAPILGFVNVLVRGVARRLPFSRGAALYFVVLSLVPLLGSLITEPAAMTLAALLLRETLMTRPLPGRLLYATVGVLFVNISIGGTLTPFAAPPVLMVANTWQWDLGFMLTHFGWKAALAVTTNAALATLVFRHHLGEVDPPAAKAASAPWSMTALNLAFLVLVVVFAHHETVFIALLLFFLGIASAYPQHQGRLLLREGLLVAFFLGGLVVLGGLQRWWLQPLLLAMDKDAVFFGATLLTAITDNAALTYLGSLVPGLDPEFQIALVAGAVTGGGLTVVANAPNPAGVSLLKGGFPENAINPLYLLFGALPPTFVAMLAFRLL